MRDASYPARWSDPTVRARISVEVKDALVDEAARRGLTLSEVVRLGIDLVLAREHPTRVPARLDDDAFGHWLAGFIDGEGSFRISRNGRQALRCDFVLALRDDDAEVLLEAQRRTGLGKLVPQFKPGNRYQCNPQLRWMITTKRETLALVELLDRYPLRAKKARDYVIWREAVLEASRMQPGTWVNHWQRMAVLREQLIEGRRYHSAAIS